MNLKKVICNNGNNNLYDYFILKEKSDIKIDKESLAYHFDKTDDPTSIINQEGMESNLDLILEIRLKNGEIKGAVPCNLEDVEFISLLPTYKD